MDVKKNKPEAKRWETKAYEHWIWAGVAIMLAMVFYASKREEGAKADALLKSNGILSLTWARQDQAPRESLIINAGLSEEPLRFSFEVPSEGIVYLDSRHVVKLSCENNADASWSAKASSEGVSGGMRRMMKGYGFDALKRGLYSCAQESTGPAKISARLLSPEQAQGALIEYDERQGVLLWAFGFMIAFAMIVGLINKSGQHALFAVFLLLNMRLAQLANGNDMTLGLLSIELDWMPRVRMVTAALSLLVVFRLYESLLKDALSKIPSWLGRWGSVSGVSACALLFLALILRFQWFLPLLWVCAVNMGLLMASRSIWLASRSEQEGFKALIISVGLNIPLMFGVFEVVGAALGLGDFMDYLNHQSGAIFASFTALVAFAIQLRDQSDKTLKAQEALRLSYQSSPMGLFRADKNGVVSQANPAILMKLGERQSSGWSMAEHMKASWEGLVARASCENEPVDVELEVLAKDGAPCWFDLRVKLDDKGRVEGSLQDSTERVLQKRRLEFLSCHDPLTECLNLRGLEMVLDRLDEGSERCVVAACIDLDRFKLINDIYGHEAGDEALKEVKNRLVAALGQTVALCRVGGGEFLAVFEHVGLDQVQELCVKALASLTRSAFQFGGKSFNLSASIGIVEAAVAGSMKARELIGVADSACRMAKKKGQGELAVYGRDSMFLERRLEVFDIAKILQSPSATSGLYLLAQPITSMSSPFESLNFEVLMRMRMPDGREIGAGPLIETAEAHGCIGKLDYWMLATMVDWIGSHIKELSSTSFICVNFSGGSINDESFLEKVFDLFERRRAEAAYLCVEITESVALRDFENTRKFIERARSLGVKVALDDFGSGYSSFGYLNELPADVLKIDGSLVKDALNNEAREAVLVSLAGLAKALGMRSIGEWAENASMVKMLSRCGLDYVQGFAVAKPMPLDQLMAAGSCADLILDAQTMAWALDAQQSLAA